MATKLKSNKFLVTIISCLVLVGLSIGMYRIYPNIEEYVEKNRDNYFESYSFYKQMRYQMYLTYVEALANENSGNTEIIPGLVRRVNLAYGYVKDYPIIKFNNLVKSRKLDFLLNIRSKRRINTEDVLNTIRLFEPKMSKGSYHSLVKDIEILTGEKVLYKYEKGVKLIDPNSKAFVDNIVKDLKFEGYII